MSSARILAGDCIEQMRTLPDQSVQMCVTSPPYFGLRDYGVDGQIGLESTPAEFVARLVDVFREVKRVLRDDGVCWINLGDSYAGSGVMDPGAHKGLSAASERSDGRPRNPANKAAQNGSVGEVRRSMPPSLKPKDLIGAPWRVAFALQADGWYLRQDIIWHKPNPMPESVRDRCTKAHEYVFLLSKSERYYYDIDAMQERATDSTAARLAQDIENQRGSDRVPGKTNGPMKAVKGRSVRPGVDTNGGGQGAGLMSYPAALTRNRRSVWTIATEPYSEAHFATFPTELPRICILAGSRVGDTVLDPFNGSGTTGAVALSLARDYIGCELNPEYVALTERRLSGVTFGLPFDRAETQIEEIPRMPRLPCGAIPFGALQMDVPGNPPRPEFVDANFIGPRRPLAWFTWQAA